MFFCTFRISPWKKMSKDVPTPGIEPGPAGWEPAILTPRPCWITCEDLRLFKYYSFSFLKSFLASLAKNFYSSAKKRGIFSQKNTFNVIKIRCFVKCNNAITPYILSSAWVKIEVDIPKYFCCKSLGESGMVGLR